MRSMSKSSYLWMKVYAPCGIREEGIGRNFRVWSRPKRIKTEAAPFKL